MGWAAAWSLARARGARGAKGPGHRADLVPLATGGEHGRPAQQASLQWPQEPPGPSVRGVRGSSLPPGSWDGTPGCPGLLLEVITGAEDWEEAAGARRLGEKGGGRRGRRGEEGGRRGRGADRDRDTPGGERRLRTRGPEGIKRRAGAWPGTAGQGRGREHKVRPALRGARMGAGAQGEGAPGVGGWQGGEGREGEPGGRGLPLCPAQASQVLLRPCCRAARVSFLFY